MFDVTPSSSPDLNKLYVLFLQAAINKLKGTRKSQSNFVDGLTREYQTMVYAVEHSLTYIVYGHILDNLGSNHYDASQRNKN